MDLPGPVVITGARSGIGRATTDLLLEAGVDVIATDLRTEGMDGLQADGADVRELDVTSPKSCDALAASVPHLAGLVNCAGTLVPEALEDVTREAWRQTFAVNLEGAFFLTQALLDRFASPAAIVNVASTAAKTGTSTELAAYAAAKAGLLSVTRTLAAHLAGRGVRVNAVCPGIIDTPMQDDLLLRLGELRGSNPEEVHRTRLATVPLGRAAAAAECAEAIAFLLSPASSYITGQALNVSGGLVTW